MMVQGRSRSVREGCILSLTLFNIFLEFVLDDVENLKEFHLDKDLSCEIRYVDTTLWSVIFEKLQLSTDELERACTKWGLKINSTKCKVMSDEADETIKVCQEEVGKVENFICIWKAEEECLDPKGHIICCQNQTLQCTHCSHCLIRC